MDEAKQAILDAFRAAINAGQSEDEIKIEMIKAGSTFKTVSKDYSEFMVLDGHVESKETKDAKVKAILEAADVSTEEGFNAAIAEITESLKGVDERSAAGMIRYFCRKAEKACYTKPKAESTRGTSFAAKFYNALIANPTMTEAEAESIIQGTEGNEETSDNVKKNAGHYQGIRKLANAIAGAQTGEDDEPGDE